MFYSQAIPSGGVGPFGVESMPKIVDLVQDQMIRAIQGQIFPAYNIIKNYDSHYTIELGVAGYDMGAFTVTFDGRNLVIDCDPGLLRPCGAPAPVFFNQGITYKKWSRQFVIAEDLEIEGSVTLNNGIMRIKLRRQPARNQKPVRLEIVGQAAPSAAANPQLLNEESDF